MTIPTFEGEVTRGQAQWLTSVKHDSAAREFIVGLTHDPENAATQRIILFAEVQLVADSWHDRDDSCMEGILGVHEQETGSGVRYTLVTERREIMIDASQRARVCDV